MKNKKLSLFHADRKTDFWNPVRKPQSSSGTRKFWIIFWGIYFLSAGIIFGHTKQTLAISSWEEELIDLTNKTRIENNLPPLEFSPKLYRAALTKAEDMAAKSYFDHYSPDGKSPWDFVKTEKYNYRAAGENLAIGFTNAPQIQKSWLASQDHRKNILDSDFREIGIAVLPVNHNGEETLEVVEFFGME